MENIGNPNLISEERKKLQKDIETATTTEGFSKLTKKQQRLIKQSLYVQIRAQRGTDAASAEAIESPDKYVTSKTRILSEYELERKAQSVGDEYVDVRKYKESQNKIANWYCHIAVEDLEQERSLQATRKNEEVDADFFQAEYFTAETLEELKKQIERFGFPCVMHISILQDSSYGSKSHTSLILGHDTRGNIVVWEKEGFGLPYQIVTLDKIYSHYGKSFYYGLRKLRHNIFKSAENK